MKKVLTIMAIFLSLAVSAQTYVSASTSFYNGTGDFGNKGMVTAEVGKQWDILSVGLAGGVTQFDGGKAFAEVRTAVTVFQKGKISVAPVIGVGYVFDSNTDYLVEYGASGTVAINKNWSVSLSTGVYHFNGRDAYGKATFTGLGITYSFK